MEKIKVLVADDQEIFREGLATLLESSPNIEVVSTCSTGFEAIKKAVELNPDVILLDTEIRECECTEVAQRIKEVLPEPRIIILTQPYKDLELSSIFKAEATAYITKNIKVGRLIGVIDTVYKGDVCLAPPIAAKLLEEFTFLEKRLEEGLLRYDLGLSKREMEVLTLLAEKSATNKEIASTLFITENTVKAHLSSILEKLHVHNRQQAVALAWEKGIVSKADS